MPKVIDKKARRIAIVEAAIAVFMEQSVASSTMQDIAKAADVAKGTLYEYFKSKDDLIVEVFAACNAEIGEHITRGIAEISDPLEQIIKTVDIVGSNVPNGNRDPLKMSFELWVEVMQNPELNKRAVGNFQRNYTEFQHFLAQRLGRAAEENLIRTVNTNEVARTVLAIIDGIFYHSVALGEPNELQARLQAGVQTFIDALRT